MRKGWFGCLALLLTFETLLAPSLWNSSRADDSPWAVNVTSAFNSDYMFRGFNLYDGMTIQPSTSVTYATADYGSFGGSVWSHFSAESNRKDEGFTEVDYTLTYDIVFEPLSFTFGHIFYTFPEDDNDLVLSTNEFFASVTFDTLLSPTLSYYRDYEAFDFNYYEINVSHKFEIAELGDGFNTTPYFAIGFASGAEKIYEDDGATHFAVGMSFDLALGDVAIIPSLNYTREIDDFTVSEFWTGITISYDFR